MISPRRYPERAKTPNPFFGEERISMPSPLTPSGVPHFDCSTTLVATRSNSCMYWGSVTQIFVPSSSKRQCGCWFSDLAFTMTKDRNHTVNDILFTCAKFPGPGWVQWQCGRVKFQISQQQLASSAVSTGAQEQHRTEHAQHNTVNTTPAKVFSLLFTVYHTRPGQSARPGSYHTNTHTG